MIWYCDSYSDCRPYIWLTHTLVQMYPWDTFGLGYVWPITPPEEGPKLLKDFFPKGGGQSPKILISVANQGKISCS